MYILLYNDVMICVVMPRYSCYLDVILCLFINCYTIFEDYGVFILFES
jgi:hypothetical protein